VIVYLADKRQFLHDDQNREIEEVIHERLRAQTGKSVGIGELRSWRESLGYVANVLRDDGIPDDIGVAVEFVIPQTAKRIDVTLAGYGDDGSKRAVIVELKQWESARASPRDAIIVTRIGGAERSMVHPSYQAWSYAALLEGFNEAVYEGGISLHPCAYLHNYRRDGVIDAPHYRPYTEKAPLFLKGEAERDELRQFIKQHVRRGIGKDILYEMEKGRIRPSKALADAVVQLLKGNPEFVLVDDQKEVYEAALAAAQGAAPSAPRVIMVEGGPGTGKSVVAVNLVAALLKRGLVTKYVSKNAAPRQVYAAKLGGGRENIRLAHLFAGSGSFVNTQQDEFDALVVDEAHRLTEQGGFYGNEGEHQVKEIINAAKCSIFFIDEDQRVTLKDIGSKEIIRAFAAARGATVEEYKLASQFRCSGSDGYLAWLDDCLDIRSTANTTLNGEGFDFKVFDDPVELHAAIQARNGNNKARVVAGYCWPWRSKRDKSAFDIVIGDYARRWNLEDDGSLWVIAPESINEVGCVHTCQGLEVDYVGVIIGPDLVLRRDRLVTVPEARDRHDKTMKGFKAWKKTDPHGACEAADRIIKNTYRTLMTRGMRGCYVYATDPALRAHLRARAGLSVPPPSPLNTALA
jgi:DUF2075 family protein